MTGDYSPVISPRNKRVEFNVSGKRLHGLFAKNSVGYINDGVLYYVYCTISYCSYNEQD